MGYGLSQHTQEGREETAVVEFRSSAGRIGRKFFFFFFKNFTIVNSGPSGFALRMWESMKICNSIVIICEV